MEVCRGNCEALAVPRSVKKRFALQYIAAMDARFRGMFLASVGFLFASIGFTLSVLSTLFRLLLPFHSTRGADVTSTVRRRTIRRSQSKFRRSIASTTNSSISSPASPSSSLESCSSSQSGHPSMSEMKAPELQNSLEPTIRVNAHNRVVSDRPDFRNTAVRRHRRSDSAPPSPAPWATSHSDCVDPPTRASVDDGALNLGGSSAECRSAFDSADSHLPTSKSTGLSFMHRRKVRRAPSEPSGMFTPEKLSPPPLPAVEKKKSQLFAPLLHKRKSQNIPDADLVNVSVSASPAEEEDHASEGRSSHDKRPSHETVRVPMPKRSQTLRTQPYEAPYFFPTPGSVEAEHYVPPRRKPVRSKTLSPDEMGVLQC